MNWLLYIGGYWIGLYFLKSMTKDKDNFGDEVILIALAWLMCWIWICFNFVK